MLLYIIYKHLFWSLRPTVNAIIYNINQNLVKISVPPNLLISKRITRNNDTNNFVQIQCFTNLLTYSFYPHAIIVWNTLLSEVLLLLIHGFQQVARALPFVVQPTSPCFDSPADFNCIHLYICKTNCMLYITDVCIPPGLFGVTFWELRTETNIIKHPNHVTTYYIQPSVPFHVEWVKVYAELNLTYCRAFTFVIADFLVDKPCRPQKPLLIDALYLNVNDYF